MKKALRETQTLRAGCSKAQPKIFAPPQTPDYALPAWRGFLTVEQIERINSFLKRAFKYVFLPVVVLSGFG